MTPEDEPTPADVTDGEAPVSEETTAEQTDSEQTDSEQTDSEQTDSEQTDSEQTDSEQTDSEQTDSEQTDFEQTAGEQPALDAAGEPVDTTQLEKAQDAIDDAREAVHRVAQTDSIDDEATGAGDLPAFAESASDTEEPTGSSEAHEENAESAPDRPE